MAEHVPSRSVGTPLKLYYRIAELYFESMERMQESLGSPEGQETVADIPNFATGDATVFISEVD